jgi:L-malate glycosyltransferase
MKDVDRGRWWRFATRYTLKRSAYFTSDAYVTRDKAVFYGMDAEKTLVFPWGVDLVHFNPEPREKPIGSDLPDNGFTLFCNRSWEGNYGVDVLARAFVKVAQQRNNVSLLLLGGGSQGALIRQILEKGGVLDRVSFLGQVGQKDLPRFYRMADVYISPSHVDGSSVSLMEALACGLSCLVSDIPANKEWVIDGKNGWLFPDGDADALAVRILAAMDVRSSLAPIGLSARQTAEARAD